MIYQKSAERREIDGLLKDRWDSLPEVVKTPVQLIGRAAISCGATHHVMEKCNFSCTCCYLGPEANKTEPLPFEEVKEQLDQLRATLGHRGRVQITAGEVTLLPLEDLGKIVSYGNSIGLDLMVMSHGQRFLDEPEYLKSLVTDYGLRKISIHIDTTQRGRAGTRGVASEEELHRVRDEAADLIRKVRRETGLPLHAASTVTVTNQNLAGMGAVMKWFLDNSDAFRLLSFQPVADVGRTRKSQSTAILNNELWKQVFTAAQRSFNTQPVLFGHSKCNNIVPLMLVKAGAECIVFEGLRKDDESDVEMFSKVMEHFQGLIDWDATRYENAATIGKILIKKPSLIIGGLVWGLKRFWAERRRFKQVLKASWRAGSLPRIRPFLIVVHNFMSPQELETDEGKERLDACVFKLSVDGKSCLHV